MATGTPGRRGEAPRGPHAPGPAPAARSPRPALPLPAAVPPAPQAGSRLAVAAALVSGAVIAALAAAFAVCCWRERARRSRGPGRAAGGGQRQQPRRKGGRWERGPSAAESGRRALGRLRQHHRRDYRLSAFSGAVLPGAHAGCSNLACQRSSENLPKLPLQSSGPGVHLLPPWAAQPPPAPHRLLLPGGPDCIDLTRGLPPGCYRSYEEHQLLHKFGRPV